MDNRSFKELLEEAARHEKFPSLRGGTRVFVQCIIGIVLFFGFFIFAALFIFRRSFIGTFPGTEIVFILSWVAAIWIVKKLFGGLGR